MVVRCQIATTLDLLTNAILAGRSGALSLNTRAELAQSLVLELVITDDNWVSKRRVLTFLAQLIQPDRSMISKCRPVSGPLALTQPSPSVTTFIDTRNGPDS